MKRFIVLILVLSLLCITIPVCASAQVAATETRIDFEDGSYMITTIEESTSLSRATKNQSRIKRYYCADNVLQWRIVLVATFTYDGTTSTCIAAGCSADVYTDNWTVISESSSRSGNTAYGYATLGKITAGVITERPSYTLTLTCDKDGNVS